MEYLLLGLNRRRGMLLHFPLCFDERYVRSTSCLIRWIRMCYGRTVCWRYLGRKAYYCLYFVLYPPNRQRVIWVLSWEMLRGLSRTDSVDE
jgi:hypothetical protein